MAASTKITITYDGDQTLQADQGTRLEALLAQMPPRRHQPLAAIVNNELQELDYPLYSDSDIIWVDISSSTGWQIYRRSLTFLLLLAMRECFPDYRLWISHSLTEGLFGWAEDAENNRLSSAQIACLEQQMRQYIDEDMPIQRLTVAKEDAVAFFKVEGKNHKASLLMRRDQQYLSLYQAHGFSDYLFGRMATHAGLLQDFRLIPFEDGFVLCLPCREYLGLSQTVELEPRKLQACLRDYQEWASLLKITTVSDLNTIVDQGRRAFGELILICETLQERIFHQITDQLERHFPAVRLVLMAGPSSSGKTTAAQRLCIQLRSVGIRPLLISMDDYFLDLGSTPLNERGNPDFEGLAAMNLPLFQEHLYDLLDGKTASLPRYDFAAGKSVPDHRQLRLEDDQLLIVEGIHAINEQVSANIPPQYKRKIFISALTQINLDENTPFFTSDNRLIRRIVRDAHSRGLSPAATLNHWNEVRRGEHCNIFPYQEQVDFFVNSALLYELPVLRPLIEDQLAAIGPEQACYLEAKRILQLIRYFSPADYDLVPQNSVLQEFIGHSIFA